jgi:hypothetical protein
VQYKTQIRAEQIRPGEKIDGFPDSIEVLGFTRRPHDAAPGSRDSDWINLQTKRANGSITTSYDAYLASEMIEVIVERDNG